MESEKTSINSENTRAETLSNETDPYSGWTDEERVEKAEIVKNEGNGFFKANKFELAVDKYDIAVNMLPNNHLKRAVYLCNKSLCSLKLERPGQALLDAEEAISIDPKNIKAYYRKSITLYALRKLKEAIAVLKMITTKLKVKNNKDINEKLKLLRKIKKETDFMKAIEYEDETDQLDPDNLAIPSEYRGPIVENDKPLSLEWVLNLLEYFKDQKRLHKKYAWMLIKKMIQILGEEPNFNYLTIEDGLQVRNKDEGEKDFAKFEYVEYDHVRYVLPQITVCGDIHGNPSLFLVSNRPTL